MDQYLINLLSYSIFRYSLWRIAEYSLQRFTQNENNFSYITWSRQPFVFFGASSVFVLFLDTFLQQCVMNIDWAKNNQAQLHDLG